jgi:hypothetical protein
MEISSVRCDFCGKLHESSGDTFFTVEGNINIGSQGGVVGNNLASFVQVDGTLANVVVRKMHYCRDECMRIVLCMSNSG